MKTIKLILVLIIGIIIGYYFGKTQEKNSFDSYIDYVIDYKTCVNSKSPSVAQQCGDEMQLRYPELFNK